MKNNDEPEPAVAPAKNHDPAAVLGSTQTARTLSVSDQHATILLSNDSLGQKALLKLTLVPFHKTELASLPVESLSEEEKHNLDEEQIKAKQELRKQEETEHSEKVLHFLSKFDWRCTSESGAEYSYHEVFPKIIVAGEEEEASKKRAKTERAQEVPYERNSGLFNAELVFPASERQISRAMPSPSMSMVYETPEIYQAVTKPFIDNIVASGSLSWLKNIVEIKKEKERLLHDGDGWILNIDTKWRTHPDTLAVPRDEWIQHKSTMDLYCLGILKTDNVASLRDLTAEHLPILRDMQEMGPNIIEKVYGVKKDQLRVFVHYQPQFYHFHVHYTRLENDIGCQVEKAHLLSDVIQDLEADSDTFAKRTLVYKLSIENDLYKKITAYSESTAKGEVEV